MDVRTLEGSSVTLDAAAIAALQAGLRLPVLSPGEPGFDDSALLWNGMIKKRPALVIRPSGVADVVHGLRFARERQLLTSIKGGGHNIAGTAIADGGLLFDLSRLKGVHVDPRAHTVRAQAGCLLGDVDRETALHGQAAVLGFVSETGISGLTLGGGFGYLTRQHGFTVDNLVEVEIVTADGKIRRAASDDEPDLFWALRGGGGNYGVVTSFTYRLHPMPPRIHGGMALWDAADAPAVLARFREWSASAPRTVTSALTMRLAPPAPFVPKEWHGRPILGWVVCHMGTDRERALEDLAPLRSVRKPIVDLIAEKTYVDQQRLLDPTQPRGPAYCWKSEFLPRLDPDLFPALLERAASVTSPLSAVTFFQLDGALSERAQDDGAVGNRDARWVCSAAGMWSATDPRAAEHEAWVRETWSAHIRPFSTGSSYVNFQGADEGEDRVRAAYGPNFARLAAIKQAVDPDNFFRLNRNVRPAR